MSGDNTVYGDDDLDRADERASRSIAQRTIQGDLYTAGQEDRYLAGFRLGNQLQSESLAVKSAPAPTTRMNTAV